jgi:hypothetical protein
MADRPPRTSMGSPEQNDAVREVLAAHGDDGSATRHVIHYAYPYPHADLSLRTQMMNMLRANEFAVKDAFANQGVVLEHQDAVTPDAFDALTQSLADWFYDQDWEYDGWECEVIKGDGN